MLLYGALFEIFCAIEVPNMKAAKVSNNFRFSMKEKSGKSASMLTYVKSAGYF